MQEIFGLHPAFLCAEPRKGINAAAAHGSHGGQGKINLLYPIVFQVSDFRKNSFIFGQEWVAKKYKRAYNEE